MAKHPVLDRAGLLNELKLFYGKAKRQGGNKFLSHTCPFERFKPFKVQCEDYCGKAFGGRYLEYGVSENACPCSYFKDPLKALGDLLNNNP